MNKLRAFRVTLMIFLLVGSVAAVFVPGLVGSATDSNGDKTTNLKFGVELSGGTRIRAPLVGLTAESVETGTDSAGEIERSIAGNLSDASPADVTVRFPSEQGDTTAVEVTSENVTEDEFAAALSEAGYEYQNIREGVTDETREQAVNVLRSKVNEAGLSGGTVREVTASNGEHFILIEVPNENRGEVLELVRSRGQVQIDIYYPVVENGTRTYETREAVLEQDDFSQVDPPRRGQNGRPPSVPVVVSDEAAEDFEQAVVETGVAQQGGTVCQYETRPQQTEPCLLTRVDGEVVYSAGMSPSLAESMRSGRWSESPSFVLQTSSYEEAQDLAIDLRAGALPAQLDVGPNGEGTTSFISPTQGERFTTNSLISGIIAVLAVSAMVFLRYGKAKIALPMILTAMSEVVILIGAAAVLQYPIDLSVIGGFIAVIGTGVDDLIIIADRISRDGGVTQSTLFEKRFKKAFWVIVAAALTTIIAMAPLAFLSLGDLRGFAIFTILGVLVGVFITRPVYGDILRWLTVED